MHSFKVDLHDLRLQLRLPRRALQSSVGQTHNLSFDAHFLWGGLVDLYCVPRKLCLSWPAVHTTEPRPALPPLGQRSDPRAHGPQAPRHPQARTADGAAQKGTAHRAARVPIRGPGAPAARPPNPARAPQTKGPAAPASHRRPRNLLAGKCPIGSSVVGGGGRHRTHPEGPDGGDPSP